MIPGEKVKKASLGIRSTFQIDLSLCFLRRPVNFLLTRTDINTFAIQYPPCDAPYSS
jgi:hypothetical protein